MCRCTRFWIPAISIRENPPLVSHPPSLEATVSGPWRNAGVLRSLGAGGLELRRVTPQHRCHGLLPVGLHFKAFPIGIKRRISTSVDTAPDA